MATLKETLVAFRAGSARRWGSERIALYEAQTDELRRSGIAEAALGAGDRAPDFSLPDLQGGRVHLSEILRRGPVVLAFYRGGWCHYCSLQLRAYQDALAEIERLGAALIAISPQTAERSLATADRDELAFPVLSDPGCRVARNYRLVFSLAVELRPVYAQSGIDLPAINGDGRWDLPIPATFVIDRDGQIVLAHVDVDYRNRLEPSQMVSALAALR
jgi:peroxiredoxin